MNRQEKDCADYVFILSSFVGHYNSRETSKISHIFKKDEERSDSEIEVFSLTLKSDFFEIESFLEAMEDLPVDMLSEKFLLRKNQFYRIALREILTKTFKGK